MDRRIWIGFVGAALFAVSAYADDAGVATYGSNGLDTTTIDQAVKPGDNFYLYTEGKWQATAEIPADRTFAGNDLVIDDVLKKRLRGIVEEAAAKSDRTANEQKIGDFYASFTDEAAIEAKGLAPIKAGLDEIEAITDRAGLVRVLGKNATHGVATPINGYVDVDAKNPNRYLFRFVQDGLSFNDREYYLKTDTEFVALRDKFRANVDKMLKLAGFSDTAAQAQQVLDLETAIAKSHWTLEKSRDDVLTYNLWKRSDLDTKASAIDWQLLLSQNGVAGQSEVLVSEPDMLQTVAKLVAEAPLDQWKAYLRYHLVSAYADYLPKAIDDEDFDFYGRTIRGQQQQQERWKRGLNLLDSWIGEVVGQVYVARYFPPSSKADMQTLVENFRTVFGRLIEKAAWMSASTKKEAMAKLKSFNAKLGYPDKWKDYSNLTIARDDLVGNVTRAIEWAWNFDINKLSKPVDRTEWFMVPQENNAYYEPRFNEIVFPAAILQAPYYDPAADAAVNYASIGSTIGHEMSHGFDDQGRKSDSKGVLRDWWTKEDAARYTKEADKLVAQYSQFEPVPGLKVNGGQTLSENIADLAGLLIAYDAYHLSLGGKEAPVIDGLTGDQRFFLAYAQAWRTKYRQERLRDLLLSDEHAPPEARVNGPVRNVDAWYSAFSIKPGDKLYLDPKQRSRPW